MDNTTGMGAHKAEVCAGLSPIGRRLFKYIEFDEDEQLIAEVRKDPIGLFFIIVIGAFITLAIVLATSFFAIGISRFSIDFGESSSMIRSVIVVVGLLLAFFSVIMTLISTILYRSNVVFITDQKIAEVVYISILNRRTLQLNIGNVEDVSVVQKGLLPRIFKYGSLIIETAGEMKNPAFTYVPEPYEVAQLIIQAHEEYVKKYGN